MEIGTFVTQKPAAEPAVYERPTGARYRPSGQDAKQAQQVVENFSRLEDPHKKGYITLDSLKKIANGNGDPAIKQLALELLNNEALRDFVGSHTQSYPFERFVGVVDHYLPSDVNGARPYVRDFTPQPLGPIRVGAQPRQ
ncbi:MULTISPECIES: hypothetical protein [unclassified Pseudomonas]|uniref:hypothetical protein n=1 Tax=unclassified Pseudomonas TaxID=196821 RepID=UPI001F577DF5|nr:MULTISPECIES: hypothetical protein [unclassified Pseudomonas]